MDFIIVFFRDILDGPVYIAVAIICGILICSCIGYLAEQSLNRKKAKEKFQNTYTTVANNVGVSVQPGAQVAGMAQPGMQQVVNQNMQQPMAAPGVMPNMQMGAVQGAQPGMVPNQQQVAMPVQGMQQNIVPNNTQVK